MSSLFENTPLAKCKSALRVRMSCDEGATSAEYAIVAVLIAAVVAGTVGVIGIRVAEMFVPVLGGLSGG